MSRLVLNKAGQWVKSIPKLSHTSTFKPTPSTIKTTNLKTTTNPTTFSDPPSSSTIPPPLTPSPIVAEISSKPESIHSIPVAETVREIPPSPIPKISILPPVKSIRGIQIPVKPPPPGSEECCMSGCAHCVYDVYLSTLQEHQERVSYTRNALLTLQPPLDLHLWPVEELGELNLDEVGSKISTEEKAKKELERVMKSLDPSMRAFLEMEARLKKKRIDRENAELASMNNKKY